MLTLVKCARCGKRYEIDTQLGGSQIKCTTCGNAVEVPSEKVGASRRDEMLATLAQAAEAERAAPSTAIPRPARAEAPQKSKNGEDASKKKPADPPCPGCGKPLPSWDRVCLVCGYDQSDKEQLESKLVDKDGFEAPAPIAIREYRRMRLTPRYKHPIVDHLDTWIPRMAIPLYAAMFAVLLAWPFIAGAMSGAMPSQKEAMQWSGLVIVAALTYFVGPLLLGVLGMKVAGRLLRFEVVTGSLSRFLLTALVSTGAAACFILQNSPGLFASLYGPTARSSIITAVQNSVTGAAILAVLAQYLCVLFFFRLKAVEAIKAFALAVLFYAGGIALWFLLVQTIGLAMLKADGG